MPKIRRPTKGRSRKVFSSMLPLNRGWILVTRRRLFRRHGGDHLDLVLQRGGQAVHDRRSRGERSVEVFSVELIELGKVFGIADVVAGLNHIRELAARRVQDFSDIVQRTAELAFKGVGHDFSLRVDGGLSGYEEQSSRDDSGAEGQV